MKPPDDLADRLGIVPTTGCWRRCTLRGEPATEDMLGTRTNSSPDGPSSGVARPCRSRQVVHYCDLPEVHAL
jgi:hypothetical protein